MFIVEYDYLEPILAWATILPLLPLLFFLDNKYQYIIYDGKIEIVKNDSKVSIFQIVDIQEAKQIKNKIILTTQNGQTYTLHFKPRDVERFLSHIAK